jgi:peptidoglycan/LPS O-acetylase OafA/YrhL
MAQHLQIHHVHSGALGVDVFFVLSGYLITGLLVTEYRNAGRIDLKGFYARRALRLYPALLVFLLIGGILTATVLHTPAGTVAFSSLFAVTYLMDILAYTRNIYSTLYSHTWSLSVEEHFYLLWPTTLAYLTRHRINVRRVAVLSGLTFLALEIVTAKPGFAPAVYFQPQSHAFGLFVGCTLALTSVPRWMRHFAGPCLVGLLAVIVMWPETNGLTYLREAVPLTALLTCGLLAGLEQSSATSRLLGLWPLRRIGVISYGLYVYHQVVFEIVVRYVHAPRHVVDLVAVAAALVIADLSYHFYEAPIRARARARTEKTAVVATTS